MSLGRPPPRHPIQTKDAARNREEQRRFDLMTTTWSEAQLRHACRVLLLPEQGLSVDDMQMALVANQVHRLGSDEMIIDDQTGAMIWPDPKGLFNRSF
jgi:hypothetical protein